VTAIMAAITVVAKYRLSISDAPMTRPCYAS
jgi:hypothetical protein